MENTESTPILTDENSEQSVVQDDLMHFVPLDALEEFKRVQEKISTAESDTTEIAEVATESDSAVTEEAPIIENNYDKIFAELGISTNEDGEHIINITQEDVLYGLREEQIDVENIEELKQIFLEYKELKQIESVLSSISKEDLNMLLAIKKVGIDQYNLINNAQNEGNPEDVLWTKYRLDHPKKSLSLARRDFEEDVLNIFDTRYDDETLREEAMKIASEHAKASIDERKQELATLAPTFNKPTEVDQAQVKQFNQKYASQYYGKVNETLTNIPSVFSTGFKTEKGDEVKFNVALTDADKKQVGEIMDKQVYFHRFSSESEVSTIDFNSLKDAAINEVLVQKMTLEAYKQGRSDENKASFERKTNAGADFMTRNAGETQPINLTRQQMEAQAVQLNGGRKNW